MFANSEALEFIIDLTTDQPKFVYNLDLVEIIDLTEEDIELPPVANPVNLAPASYEEPDPDQCPICTEQEADIEFPLCHHKFCLLCTLDWILTSSNHAANCPTISCPNCRSIQPYNFTEAGDLNLLCEAIQLEEDSKILNLEDPDGLFEDDEDWDV